MPVRTTPLVTGQYYHIYNRGVEKRQIFNDKWDYSRAIETFKFYRLNDLPLRLSEYHDLILEARKVFEETVLNERNGIVDFISYNLMPNHYHFLLQQTLDNGISEFLRRFSDSYTRYFNVRNDRCGSLFQGTFKAVLIESSEQLLHVSRYIHLNPYSSFLVKDLNSLIDYPWSSLREYISDYPGLCKKDIILENFSSKEEYKKFIFDQADYQRGLENIKHLIIE